MDKDRERQLREYIRDKHVGYMRSRAFAGDTPEEIFPKVLDRIRSDPAADFTDEEILDGIALLPVAEGVTAASLFLNLSPLVGTSLESLRERATALIDKEAVINEVTAFPEDEQSVMLRAIVNHTRSGTALNTAASSWLKENQIAPTQNVA